jgi:hypothetical protein
MFMSEREGYLIRDVIKYIIEVNVGQVTGERRKLHSEELHNLYSSPNIIRQIKSGRLSWAGHVARIGGESKVYKFLV